MATVKSLRVVVLAAPKERKMWYKAARKAAISLAEYMRQAANEKLTRNALETELAMGSTGRMDDEQR